MSSFVYGDLVFKTKLPFAELCNFAESLRAYNIGAMHLKFGGNVSNMCAHALLMLHVYSMK